MCNWNDIYCRGIMPLFQPDLTNPLQRCSCNIVRLAEKFWWLLLHPCTLERTGCAPCEIVRGIALWCGQAGVRLMRDFSQDGLKWASCLRPVVRAFWNVGGDAFENELADQIARSVRAYASQTV